MLRRLLLVCSALLMMTSPVFAQRFSFKHLRDFRYSGDGSKILAVGDRVRLYDAESGTLIRSSPVLTRYRSVSLSPVSEELFATAGQDDVQIWFLRKPEPAVTFRGLVGSIKAVEFAPDKKLLFVGGEEEKDRRLVGTAILFDYDSESLYASLDFEGKVWCGAFSGDGQHLLIATTDGKNKNAVSRISVYDVEQRKMIRQIEAGDGFLTDLGVAGETGQIIAVGGRKFSGVTGGYIRVANIESDQPAIPIDIEECGMFYSIDMSPDGKSFVTGTRTGNVILENLAPSKNEIHLRNTTSGEIVWKIDLPDRSSAVKSIRFSPDGTRIACCGSDDLIIINAKTGKLLRRATLEDENLQ